jgi:hypothetical protein
MSKSPRHSRESPGLHGVVFVAENSAIRIIATARSDLMKDRMGLYAERVWDAVGNPDRVVPIDVIGLIETPSAKCAASLVGALSQFWRSRGRVVELGVHGPEPLKLVDVKASLKLVSKAYGFKVHHMNDVMRGKPKRGGSAHLKDIVEPCLVPDPMLTDAEFLHRRAKSPGNDRVGMVQADVNMSTRIGGLALLRTRQQAHQEAARRFKAMFEGGRIGAPRAIDPEAIRVDRSASNDGGLFEIGEGSRRAYIAVQTALGVGKVMFLEKMLVHEVSVSAIARATYGNAGGAARMRVSEAFRLALDDLAVHFKLASKRPAPPLSVEVRKVFTGQADAAQFA